MNTSTMELLVKRTKCNLAMLDLMLRVNLCGSERYVKSILSLESCDYNCRWRYSAVNGSIYKDDLCLFLF